MLVEGRLEIDVKGNTDRIPAEQQQNRKGEAVEEVGAQTLGWGARQSLVSTGLSLSLSLSISQQKKTCRGNAELMCTCVM